MINISVVVAGVSGRSTSVLHLSMLRKHLKDLEQKIEAKLVSLERLSYGMYSGWYLRVAGDVK
jgi:hypothetical protein